MADENIVAAGAAAVAAEGAAAASEEAAEASVEAAEAEAAAEQAQAAAATTTAVATGLAAVAQEDAAQATQEAARRTGDFMAEMEAWKLQFEGQMASSTAAVQRLEEQNQSLSSMLETLLSRSEATPASVPSGEADGLPASSAGLTGEPQETAVAVVETPPAAPVQRRKFKFL